MSMRIWDVAAGYLNRQSLLGEHRELHGLRSILVNDRTGYSRHPETLRWVGALGALALRHDLLAAEMRLRGYVDRTPLRRRHGAARWPAAFVTAPGDQLVLLRQKYMTRASGRIALPQNAQQLWAQHKYSVMARSPETYTRIGRSVARMRRGSPMRALAADLVMILRETPDRIRTAVEHMWGHVRDHATADDVAAAKRGWPDMLSRTQAIAMRVRQPYLVSSTALSELAVFIRRHGVRR